MSDEILKVDRNDSQLVVSGTGFANNVDQGPWTATRFDRGRILLVSKESGSNVDKCEGVVRCSTDILHDILVGLHARRWSGQLTIDTGFGQKKLYFNHGGLTFAGSGLMDDRLGEVIYREGMISLDQLTTSAVQVDRSTKFGQILLRDRIFSNTELWNALKTQVREIFRSVFLVSNTFVEIGRGTPPTEVTFDEGTNHLIESAFSAGAQFQTFFKRLSTSTRVNVADGERVATIRPGTFLADMIALARQNQSIDELLTKSKLTDINTLWVLHRMSCLGYLSFSGLGQAKLPLSEAGFANLKGKLDAFALLENMTIKAFTSCQTTFPVGELQRFAWSLNEGNVAAIYIDDAGLLGADCVGNIMSQCAGNLQRVSYFETRIDGLIRYVLQMCGDLLPQDVAKNLRKQFAEIS